VHAVIFDFYGTLTVGRTGSLQRAARDAQALALGVDADAFDAELTASIDERFRGAGGDIQGSLAWVCERLGHTPSAEQLEAGAAVRLARERQFGEPRPDAPEVLTALRDRGLKIGLISDCSSELPAYFNDLSVAPYIDAPVFSVITGARKPDPDNYLTCCKALGVEPTECVYVGDGGSNELAGARAVGMRAVHLAVPAEQGSVVYERHVAWDGETISTLTELLTLL